MVSIKNSAQKLITKDSDNRFDVYSNHTGIVTTGFDFKLIFGSVQMATESEVTVLQHGAVTMSPQHAKVFCRSLLAAVENYEKSFGEVNFIDKNDNGAS